MTNAIRAANQLRLYRRYSDMAGRAGGELREAYLCMARDAFLCMARDALRQAAKFDPAAVAHASALTMANVG